MFRPVPEIIEWISKAGVATTRRNSRDGSVIFRASVRVARFTVLEISQRMSSASTADRAKLVEKRMLASDCAFGRRLFSSVVLARSVDPSNGAPSCCALRSALPDRMGNSFCETAKATTRKVRMNGSADTATAMGLRCRA